MISGYRSALWPITFALSLVRTVTAGPACAQQAAALEELAKLRANPLSGLRTVTLQDQVNFDSPFAGQSQHVITLQAVWPLPLGHDWSLIANPILSVISQPGLDPGETRVSGLGDTVLTAVITPNEEHIPIDWGLGAVLELPTATDHELGSNLWAAGPALVVFVERDPSTVGVLLENAWSFAGSGHEKINAFSAQYFLNYNLWGGWFLESNATVTADWEADQSDRWTVPLGGGFGKVFTLGSHSLSLSTQAFYNEPRPSNGPKWSVVLGLQLLFPG
jgi:hypothetical protein